ncbi:hypothetical protein Syun_016425 [Stephania yunnanensis]|uniref:Uncharacterized protein n=1 Tax=Stephania yunnanensis TaxID=152371 RepID=A0AAP0P264_9MAGN
MVRSSRISVLESSWLPSSSSSTTLISSYPLVSPEQSSHYLTISLYEVVSSPPSSFPPSSLASLRSTSSLTASLKTTGRGDVFVFFFNHDRMSFSLAEKERSLLDVSEAIKLAIDRAFLSTSL